VTAELLKYIKHGHTMLTTKIPFPLRYSLWERAFPSLLPVPCAQSQQSILCLIHDSTTVQPKASYSSHRKTPDPKHKKCFKALLVYSFENALVIWDPSIHGVDTGNIT